MTDWPHILRKPANLATLGVAASWFDAIADKLLNGVNLRVDGQMLRLIEIEFFMRAGEHPDPFTHGDPLQMQCGHWYFHRNHGVYRSGSFKGLDLTFGDGTFYGGVLLRGVALTDGSIVDGPSLLVDLLLKRTKVATVSALDALIAGRAAWDTSSPVYLADVETLRKQPILRCGRVGLTLKNTHHKPEATRYILRPYRYLTEPRQTAKGKVLMVLALHTGGANVEEIYQTTGCPRRSILRYLKDFKAGRGASDFAAYLGVDLKPADLCRMYGTWHNAYPI